MVDSDATDHQSLPVKVGLTGGIASGKSTAERFFEELGIPSIDHDKLAKEVVSPGSTGLDQLIQLASPNILTSDGHLDRPALKALIFQDPVLKKQVEQIIHPLVFVASEAIRRTYKNVPYVLIVSPLLVESGHWKSMYKLIVVDIPVEEQIKRLLARDNISMDIAVSIIEQQATRQARNQVADFILKNNNKEQLKHDVLECHKTLLSLLGR